MESFDHKIVMRRPACAHNAKDQSEQKVAVNDSPYTCAVVGEKVSGI